MPDYPNNSSESTPYIVDVILPSHRVHLIGGPSGVGKTRLIFQEIIYPLENGLDVFGYKSYPCRIAYIACDRLEQSAYAIINSMNLPLRTPILSIINMQKGKMSKLPGLNDILDMAPRDTKLVIIDGIAILLSEKSMSDYQQVAMFLINMTRICLDRQITIIGVTHTSKFRARDLIFNPIERFMGSVAWGAYSETSIYMGPKDPSDLSNNKRSVIISSKLAAAKHLVYQFDEDGRLVNIQDDLEELIMEEGKEDGTNIMLDQIVQSRCPVGQTFDSRELLALSLGLKISKASFHRWLHKRVSNHVFEKVNVGLYLRMK